MVVLTYMETGDLVTTHAIRINASRLAGGNAVLHKTVSIISLTTLLNLTHLVPVAVVDSAVETPCALHVSVALLEVLPVIPSHTPAAICLTRLRGVVVPSNVALDLALVLNVISKAPVGRVLVMDDGQRDGDVIIPAVLVARTCLRRCEGECNDQQNRGELHGGK